MKNKRREDGRKVKNKRKVGLSNMHKEVQKAANGRENGRGICSEKYRNWILQRLKYFSVQ